MNEYSEKAQQLVAQLTLDEKLSLLTGKNFWVTQPFPRLGVSSMEVADGPYGLRKQVGISDHMGWNKSQPAVAYVSGPGMASSWDKDLIREAGRHLGVEAKAAGVDILLGPAINIVRTPLCGRNFEYYSEDPRLAGEMAAAYIKGVQSTGVGTCIKHFAANNQEKDREYIDAVMDERTLREIYLAAFERPIKEAKPWSVMTALNKVNGDYCSENRTLLQDILRDEWGYEGFVMSDWNGVNDRAKALAAGLDLEMPCSHGVGEERIRQGLADGTVTEKEVDESCCRILCAVLQSEANRDPDATWNEPAHHDFVRQLAEQCVILLKNEGNILPLSAGTKIAVLGEFATEPRFQMDGSALVNPTRHDVPLEKIKEKAEGQVLYGKGCSRDPAEQAALLAEAGRLAAEADVALVFAGLPAGVEAEGKDRKDMKIPAYHDELIRRVLTAQKNTVVVLCNGSPVEMPWAQDAAAILECFLGGQALGGALANILYGEVNPSGKLPVTFPKALENNPSYLNYPGQGGRVEYQEGVFVGYRYYDAKHIDPLFCFGHGLSYTTFEYGDLTLSAEHLGDDDTLTARVTVTNTGSRAGAEVVQLYVAAPKGAVLRPEKELRGFEKVFLQPGESKTVEFTLTRRDFAYYDMELGEWYAPEGEYKVLAASSSRDVRCEASVQYHLARIKRREITGWSTIGELRACQAGQEMYGQIRSILKASGNPRVLELPLFDESEQAKDRVNDLPLRMVTLLSDNILNNDIMDRLIAECNQKALQTV